MQHRSGVQGKEMMSMRNRDALYSWLDNIKSGLVFAIIAAIIIIFIAGIWYLAMFLGTITGSGGIGAVVFSVIVAAFIFGTIAAWEYKVNTASWEKTKEELHGGRKLG
jgi:hypothetical protein